MEGRHFGQGGLPLGKEEVATKNLFSPKKGRLAGGSPYFRLGLVLFAVLVSGSAAITPSAAHGRKGHGAPTTTAADPTTNTTAGQTTTTLGSTTTTSTTSTDPTTTTTTLGSTTTTTTATLGSTTTTTTTTPPSGSGGMTAPPGYSSSILDDSFTGTSLNSNIWNTYISCSGTGYGAAWSANGTGGSGGTAGGTSYAYYEPSQVSVNNGLNLTAVTGSAQPGYGYTSGVVATWNKFEFTGGYVQIKAKIDSAAALDNGVWPALWMLDNGCNHEIDIFEGGFTGTGTPSGAFPYTYHEPDGSTLFSSQIQTSEDLGGGYHIYGLKWVPGQSITWYLDGQQVGQITSAEVPIVSDPMELLIDNDVACPTCGWHSGPGATTPSPSTMQVAEVQVWQ